MTVVDAVYSSLFSRTSALGGHAKIISYFHASSLMFCVDRAERVEGNQSRNYECLAALGLCFLTGLLFLNKLRQT